MGDPVPFRKFKIPEIVETGFFSKSNELNESFCKEDLARSGLTPLELEAYTHPMLQVPQGTLAAYGIPYYGLDGNPITNSNGELVMYRLRLKTHEFSKQSRYTQPSGEQLAKHGLPPYIPYIPPGTWRLGGDTLYLCEGEKKTAAVLRYLRVPAIGIGGCQMWRDPAGTGGVHPWIRDCIARLGVTNLTIIPDGDVFRYDISSAYGTFARAAESLGLAIRIVRVPTKIDDELVKQDNPVEWFSSLESIAPNELVQSADSLIKTYSLAFKQDAKGRLTMLQHSSNVMRLMEEHPAFPKIWRNEDTNRVMLGDKPATPDLTEMELANYLQHNLGMDKVSHRVVYPCIQALAKRNSRSPFLEHIRSMTWDGVDRLDTWMIRLWGAEDDSFVREVSRKWLISSCARLAQPGVKIDWMLIVVGPQATGKTSMPALMFNGCNTTLYGEHNDKDLHMLLHSSLCIGFDELDSFSKRETSNLKAMITRNEDMFRPPYGASVEVFPRRFVLYGCGNRYEFLQHDPSGYRRYAVVEVKEQLKFAELEKERDQLWAEAWHYYMRAPGAFYEIENASKNAERFVVANPLEEMITNWLTARARGKMGDVKDGTVIFTMTSLLTGLDLGDPRNTNVTREVAAILKSLGAEQKNGTNPVTGVRGRFYTVPLHKLV